MISEVLRGLSSHSLLRTWHSQEPMIELIQGSIFDRKCDLLVVPCNSSGGVTSFVYSNLEQHGLATHVGPIPYGGVHFVQAKYAFASALGYAASVDAQTSAADQEHSRP